MDLCQRRLVHRRAADLIVAHNASRKGKLFRCLFRPVVTDNQSGLQVPKDQFNAHLRHLLIDRHIEAAAPDYAEEGCDLLRVLIHEHYHRLFIEAFPVEPASDRIALVIHLPEGQCIHTI